MGISDHGDIHIQRVCVHTFLELDSQTVGQEKGIRNQSLCFSSGFRIDGYSQRKSTRSRYLCHSNRRCFSFHEIEIDYEEITYLHQGMSGIFLTTFNFLYQVFVMCFVTC